MKRILSILIVLLLLFTVSSGCKSYNDLDKLLFVTSMILDVNEKDNTPIIYFETFKTKADYTKMGSTKERIIYKIPGKTVTEIINTLNTFTSSNVTFSHNKIIMFTKKAAEHGIQDYLDGFDSKQDIMNRTILGLFDSDIEDYTESELQEEKTTGIFLYNLINNCTALSGKSVIVTIKEFSTQKYMGDRVNALPVIKTVKEDGVAEKEEENNEDTGGAQKQEKQQQSQNTSIKFQVTGIALIKGYQFIGTLDGEESKIYNLLNNNMLYGVIVVPNPIEKGKFITLSSLQFKYKSELDFDGKTLHVKRTFRIKTSLKETQSRTDLDDETVQKFEKATEQFVTEGCNKLFEKYKSRKTDIFNIQEEFERKYPKYKNRSIITDTVFEPVVVVEIEGSTKFLSFW